MAPHWKCGSGQPVAGSNPALSATCKPRDIVSQAYRSGFETLGSHHSPVTARNPRPGPWVRDVRGSTERSPSGLWRRTGNAVRGNPSGVRIPPSPPPFGSDWEAPRGSGLASRYTPTCRARRGTSGALYLQSAPAGLNSPSRPPRTEAANPGDDEDRVPRSGDSRSVSGPEGSSTKRSSPGAAERPGPSRLRWWARARLGRQGVHGILRKPSIGPRGAS